MMPTRHEWFSFRENKEENKVVVSMLSAAVADVIYLYSYVRTSSMALSRITHTSSLWQPKSLQSFAYIENIPSTDD